MLDQKVYADLIDEIINDWVSDAKDTIQNLYSEQKRKLETAVLKDEYDPSKNEIKHIPTELSFEDSDKNNFLIKITAGSELENLILHAQSIGTANVSDEILNFFGLDSETSDRLNMGRKYFNPTGAHTIFRNDLVEILGGQKDMP